MNINNSVVWIVHDIYKEFEVIHIIITELTSEQKFWCAKKEQEPQTLPMQKEKNNRDNF